MISFEATSFGQAWLKSMSHIMQTGSLVYDEDIRLKEICNLGFRIDSISEDDIIIQKYANQERINLLKRKYATKGLVPPYTIDYGSLIYDNNGVDQIEWVVNKIKKKPETKQGTIALNKPGDNQIPCLSLMNFKYRNDKLLMTVVYTTQNVFSSQPGNLLALRQIQKNVAANIGVEMGHVELLVLSAHIYESDFKEVEAILKATELH